MVEVVSFLLVPNPSRMFHHAICKSRTFLFIIKGFMVFLLLSTALLVVNQSSMYSKIKNGFKLVYETKSLARDIPVYKYESLKTGLHVIIAKVDGPLVQGFFTIATEAHDDDGLPHTLEHLVFLGSEDYPYKGVLDLLANRCLAEGTNAWTDTDHTAYTVATAGSDGFLSLLPIYLDHLLFPILADAAFTTEIYHVTGQGKDAGVVYSEMQAIENTGPHLALEALIRILYSEPSGYHYETGGKLANLRESTTNSKIRDFHKNLYRPENLHVIITGQVDPEEVFKALKPIEDKIVSKGERGNFSKPWRTSLPPFNESKDVEIVYPSDTEDTGIVHVGWRGPSVVNDITEFQSVAVLLKFLTDSSVSPLPKAFIEVKDPFASEVDDDLLRNSESSCILSFFGVPKDKIGKVKPLLEETLKKLVNGTIPFDLAMMRDMLNNLILKEERNLETAPHPVLADMIINDLLYGDNYEYLDKILNKITWYQHLLTESTSYWIGLMEKYMTSSPSATVRGIPSIAKAKELQDEEERRISKRVAELGEEGLKKLGKTVDEAKRVNEIPPPQSSLESVPLPSIENVNFHSIRAYTNIKNHRSGNISSSEPNLFDLDTVPVKMQLDDVKSNFVEMVVVLDTHSLSYDERLYLPLLQKLLLESSIAKEDGGQIPYVDVVKTLNADTVRVETMNGLTLMSSTFSFGQYFHAVGFHMQVEMAKYERGVKWVSDILFRVVFDPERINIKASKLLNSIGDKKREGNVILSLMYSDVVYKNATNINAVNPLRQEKFLNSVIQKLKTDPSEVLQNLEKVYRKITQLDNITIHMATNLAKLASLTNILKPWSNVFPSGLEPASMELNMTSDWEEHDPFVENDATTAYVASVGSVESAYMFQTTPAIFDYSHLDLPVLMTVINYLTQLEGPMWKQIRGKGLAYNYRITIKPNEGLLSLKLGTAAQLTAAHREAVKIINAHVNDSSAWDRLLFESARSSLIYEIIEREAEITDVVQQSLYAYYRKVPHDFNRSFLQALEHIELKDLHGIANKYLRPLIDPKLSRTLVVCPPSRAKEVASHFNEMGHNLEVIEVLEKSRFAELYL